MSNTNIFEAASKAHERDPRQHPYGYLTGGVDEFDSVRVFVWFRTIQEMIESLLEVEPRMYGVEPKRGLEAYQERVRPILARLPNEGLNPSLLAEFAPESDGRFALDWWGTYGDLRNGCGVLGCRLVDEYLGEERCGQLLPSTEESAFINFLRPTAA